MSLKWVTGTPTGTFMPKFRDFVAGTSRNIAHQVWEGAVMRTPVNSGELRASWNLSIGKPNYVTYGEPNRSSSVPGSAPSPSAPNLPKKLGAKYFVSNGKRYAGAVEFGSPTTTPALMLTRAVNAVDL